MKEDPIQYAQDKLTEMLDSLSVMNQDMERVNKAMNYLQKIIIEYFSESLQTDETPMGAMRRNQIRKELLEFAHGKV